MVGEKMKVGWKKDNMGNEKRMLQDVLKNEEGT